MTLTPDKRSRPRQFEISLRTCSAVNMLPKKNTRIFATCGIEKFRRNYEKQRRKLAMKLGNLRPINHTPLT